MYSILAFKTKHFQLQALVPVFTNTEKCQQLSAPHQPACLVCFSGCPDFCFTGGTVSQVIQTLVATIAATGLEGEAIPGVGPLTPHTRPSTHIYLIIAHWLIGITYNRIKTLTLIHELDIHNYVMWFMDIHLSCRKKVCNWSQSIMLISRLC